MPRLMVADLTRDGKFVTPKIDSLTEEGAKQSRPMKKGDIVIAVSGNPGLPAILLTDACIHDGFVGLRNLNKLKVSTDFLFWFLTYSKNKTNYGAVGAIFKNLTTDQIKNIDIPLPPLEEQRRIAEILDKADALREKRRRSLKKLDTLLQSVFLDMFGDPVKNEKGWKKKSVEDAVELINGRAFKPTEWSNKGLPIVRIQNLKNKDSTYNYFEGTCEKKYVVKAGDLLLSWAGQLVSFGVVIWTGSTGWLNQHIFRVVPKLPFEISYLEFALSEVIEKAKSKFRGIEMKHITKADLNKYKLPYPPIELQKLFALRVEKIRTIQSNLEKSLYQINNLFQSLQQRAFNGELFSDESLSIAAVAEKATADASGQKQLFD